MLLCEDFGGRHQRDLVSVFYGDDGGLEGDDGLARAYVALQQAAHGKRFFHVGRDFLEHPFLRVRRMEWENLLDGGAGAIIQLNAIPGLCFLFATFKLKSQLEQKQLLENEANMSQGAEIGDLEYFRQAQASELSAMLRAGKSG